MSDIYFQWKTFSEKINIISSIKISLVSEFSTNCFVSSLTSKKLFCLPPLSPSYMRQFVAVLQPVWMKEVCCTVTSKLLNYLCGLPVGWNANETLWEINWIITLTRLSLKWLSDDVFTSLLGSFKAIMPLYTVSDWYTMILHGKWFHQQYQFLLIYFVAKINDNSWK